MDLYFETAASLHDMLKTKKITATELTEAVISRLEETEKNIGAYLTVTKENAMTAAKKTDEKIAKGEEIGFL